MNLTKYIQVAKTGWENGFVYRLNFAMWRVRNILQILTVFFLWLAVMDKNPTAFNYNQSQMLTYILGTSIMRALVFGQRSIDAQKEISSGDLNNYLIKPINYFQYWFSRDIADKLLNIIFSVGELIVLFLLIKPPVMIQSNILFTSSFLIASILAMIMYFYFSFIISMTTFWVPEGNGWPQRFFIFVSLEFFAGGLFPLDILPPVIFTIVKNLPSAYFLNFPLQIYLGRIAGIEIFSGILIMVVWIIIFQQFAQYLFSKGLKIYGAYGR